MVKFSIFEYFAIRMADSSVLVSTGLESAIHIEKYPWILQKLKENLKIPYNRYLACDSLSRSATILADDFQQVKLVLINNEFS